MKNNSKKADRIQDPPEFAVKFANAVFVLGVIFSVLIIVYAIYRIYNPVDSSYIYYSKENLLKYYIKLILIGGAGATLFGLGLRKLNNDLKVNLFLLIITTGISVYAFETYLEISRIQQQMAQMAEKMGVPYDTRTKLEVLKDLRKDGFESFPVVYPDVLLADSSTRNGLNARGGKVFPLGGISNITTVFCKEAGYWSIYESDEHGFNNSKGLYNKNRVDIVLIGDSFTQGACLKPDETISAVLRKSDFNTISFGKGGNGPLIEFATLKEYAKLLKPKIVLWVYFATDLDFDLDNELNSSFLRRYFNEENFTQNLISRQEEIDSVLVDYVQQREREREIQRERGIQKIIYKTERILKLTNLRTRINLTPHEKTNPTSEPTTPGPMLRNKPPKPEISESVFEAFNNILDRSKKTVSGWGGKMYFVYLPEFFRYFDGEEHINREFVLRTATKLGIPIIDIHTDVFAPHPDPLSLFPFRSNNHYSADGYRLVTEAIIKRLEADGFIPSNSNN